MSKEFVEKDSKGGYIVTIIILVLVVWSSWYHELL